MADTVLIWIHLNIVRFVYFINQQGINMKNSKFVIALFVATTLTSCAGHKVHIYTPEEQAGMTTDGAIPTMMTPSEVQEHFKQAGKVSKPTGHVSYCNAGLVNMSARSEALKAIGGVCGGHDQYTIVRAGPVLDGFNTGVGTSCARSERVIFKCNRAPTK